MDKKYLVTVQELHEKKYLVSNAVAPQQAQEWVEIHIEDNLSDLLEENIEELESTFVTEGRNNIVESLRDIKIETVGIEYDSFVLTREFIIRESKRLGISESWYEEKYLKPYLEKRAKDKRNTNNTEWLKNTNPDVPVMSHMGCTCGYDEEEDVSTMDGNLSDIQEAYKGFIKKHAPNWNNEETCCPDDKGNCNS